MKYIVSGLVFPGTILHPKKGKIDLYKADQKTLEEIFLEGSQYIIKSPGDPPDEKPIEVKRIPKAREKKKTKYKPQTYREPDKEVSPDDDDAPF